MISAVYSPSHATEMEFLDRLRSRYEREGFRFTVAPRDEALPTFFKSYRPDAIAQKPGHNIAIEVKSRRSDATRTPLRNIRRLFDGHPDWRFSVVFMGNGSAMPSVRIPGASADDIRRRTTEIVALADQGQHRAAFVLAWSLLESALQTFEDADGGTPRTPGTVVQTLAMSGYIDTATERIMRNLIPLRDLIVHGDVRAEPSDDDVRLILSVVDSVIGGG